MKKHFVTGAKSEFYGWDASDGDTRLLGIYVGGMVATARFSTPQDAAEADNLLRFLVENLAGCTLADIPDLVTWPAGARPADEPLSPVLAEAFEREMDSDK